MAFDRIKRMKQHLKDLREHSDTTMRLYADFLEPGTWRVSKNQGFLYKKGYQAKQKNENRFIIRLSAWHRILDKTERLSRFLFAKAYRFKKKTVALEDAGQILLFTYRKDTVKVMNPDRQFLLTIYSSSEELQNYLSKRDLWVNTGCFSVPPLLKVDYERRYIKEAFLQKSKFSYQQAFEQILIDYKHFFELFGKESAKASVSKEEAESSLKAAEKYGLSALAKQALDFMRSDEYRVNLSHGDMAPQNLICSAGKYYYIDFDTVGTRFFFYDLLYYIVMSSLKQGASLLQKYLQGELDEPLSEVFRLNGAHYDPEKRRVYLMVLEILMSCFGRFPQLLLQKELWQDLSKSEGADSKAGDL